MRTAVLIPCRNEASTIAKVVGDYRSLLPDADVYVYDNNSADDSALIAAEAGAIVVPEYRQGKGFVVRSMFRDIDADVYLMVDGDDTYEAADIAALAAPIEEGRADMVVGDRLSSSIVAVVLLAGAVVLFIPPLEEYVETGLVQKFPSLIVAMVLGISSLLALFARGMMDSLRKQSRMLHESELHRWAREYGRRLPQRGRQEAP